LFFKAQRFLESANCFRLNGDIENFLVSVRNGRLTDLFLEWRKSTAEIPTLHLKLFRRVVKSLALLHHQRKDVATTIKLIESFPDALYQRAFLERWGYYKHIIDLDIREGRFSNVAENYEKTGDLEKAAEFYLKGITNISNFSISWRATQTAIMHIEDCSS
jgi:hypothetical protein